MHEQRVPGADFRPALCMFVSLDLHAVHAPKIRMMDVPDGKKFDNSYSCFDIIPAAAQFFFVTLTDVQYFIVLHSVLAAFCQLLLNEYCIVL